MGRLSLQAPSYDDACYTLVSCGARHVKFYTLLRTEASRVASTGGRVAARGGGARFAPALPRARGV